MAMMLKRPAFFSTQTPTGEPEEAVASPSSDGDPSEDAAGPAVDQVAELEAKLKEQKDQMLRALADAENARTIAKRDVENARQFAVTKFAKSLLDVADNLTLAMGSIPAEVRKKEKNVCLLLTIR